MGGEARPDSAATAAQALHSRARLSTGEKRAVWGEKPRDSGFSRGEKQQTLLIKHQLSFK